MASGTVKQRKFVSEPMRGKPVTELAGIAEGYGKKLNAAGFSKAENVLGQFLVLDKDEQRFTEWLKSTANVDDRNSGYCYRCLKEWYDAFM